MEFTFSRWRYEALRNRCIIKNREILLENNNIKFEAKPQNIRQIVEKEYSSIEEPMIDNFDLENIPSQRATDSKKDKTDNCWTDLKYIVSTFSQPSKMQNTNAECDSDHTIIILPSEKSTAHNPGALNKFRTYNEINELSHSENASFEKQEIMSSDMSTQPSCPQLSSNNIMLNKNAEFNATNMKTPINLKTDKMYSTELKAEVNQNSKSLSGSIKQINVEMFTVTLKPKK